jgi:hypothetical protein
MRRPWPTSGCGAIGKKKVIIGYCFKFALLIFNRYFLNYIILLSTVYSISYVTRSTRKAGSKTVAATSYATVCFGNCQ